MGTDDDKKKWGTIFLDGSREASMEQLDSMQAATRQQQWNQRTQQDYLEKVRAKATERAREILGEAYTERQKVLDEARDEAESVRLTAAALHHEAEQVRAEAEQIREAAQEELRKAEQIREAAQAEGFDAGLEQAQAELESFRAALGSSVAGVLMAIHGQCHVIFEGWRGEMVELLKVCVEKGTGLVLDEQYPLVLEHLVMEAVRQLDDRRCITLRVHPDDEAAVADMFAAAKERLPHVGQWIVSGDTSLQLGGLIAESQSGTVDSRLELHRDLVQNILQHLVLPGTQLDSEALHSVEEAVRLEAEKIAVLAPPVPEPEPAPAPIVEPEPEPVVESELGPEPESVMPAPAAADAAQEAGAACAAGPETLVPDGAAHRMADPASPTLEALPEQEDMPDSPAWESAETVGVSVDTEELDELGEPEELASELANGLAAPEAEPAPLPASAEPTRDQLEEELFDLPVPTPLDNVLAQGGFLDDEEPRS